MILYDIYRVIIGFLVWLSAEPGAVDIEAPRAAAAVAAARASLATGAPVPEPQPEEECCGECEDGYLVMPDGHRVQCPCPPGCECKTSSVLVQPQENDCPDGKCKKRSK